MHEREFSSLPRTVVQCNFDSHSVMFSNTTTQLGVTKLTDRFHVEPPDIISLSIEIDRDLVQLL
jgi:hypothetical protein